MSKADHYVYIHHTTKLGLHPKTLATEKLFAPIEDPCIT